LQHYSFSNQIQFYQLGWSLTSVAQITTRYTQTLVILHGDLESGHPLGTVPRNLLREILTPPERFPQTPPEIPPMHSPQTILCKCQLRVTHGLWATCLG